MIGLRIAFFITVSLVSGCGTINTVFLEDDAVARALKKSNTNCSSIPRLYSGIFYNLCILHGPENWGGKDPAAPESIPFQMLDIIPSGVLDTFVLPYTIYRQSVSGDINIPK